MPVRFRGVSEYSNSFKWSPSFRSAKFQPTEEQTAPEAGLRSDQMNLLLEPTFTRKRQVPHRRPEAQSIMMWCEDADVVPCLDEASVDDIVKDKTYVVAKKSPLREKAVKKHSLSSTKKKKVEQVREKEVQSSKPKRDPKAESQRKQETSAVKEDKLLESSTQTEKFNEMKSRKMQTEPKMVSQPKKAPKTSPKNADSPSKKIPLRYRPRKMRYTSAHQTEYQQMYRKPTRFVPSSPLISALDVVHSSSQAIPPHKSPRMPMKSEYEAKFQSMSPLSKSLPTFSSPPSPSLRLKVKNMPTSPLQVHRSPKRTASEYAKQFASKDFPVESQERLWDDANRNKLNRDACNFDKSHAIQLMSPKNRCWDVSSAGSTTVAETESSADKDIKSTESVAGSDVDRDSAESIISMEQDSLATHSFVDKTSSICSIGEKPVARKLAWGESSETLSDAQADDNDENDDDNTITGTDTEGAFEGRLPTPEIKQIGGALRTHHDLTTPCTGGALLSSPPVSPRNKTYPPTRFQKLQKETLPKEKLETPMKKETPVKDKKSKKPVASEKKEKPIKPAAAESKSAMPAKPQASKTLPLPRRMERSPRAPIQGSLRDQEFQHYGRNTRPISFDQVSMVSSRSSASASQLLERSLQRKDFWQK